MTQPLRVSMLLTGDASGLTAATGEARRAVAGVGASAKASAGDLARLAAANDEAARAAKAAAQAAAGQSRAQRDLSAAIANFAGIRPDTSSEDYARRQADVEAFGRSLDELRAKYNPVFAASKAYERELGELSRALALGAINAGEHDAALERLNAQYTASTRATAAFAAQSGIARMQTANLAFQFQDIGTMLASGQNPFMLLAQQLPQVTMYGGQLSGIMGALKQTVAGLFSPLGLVTTGFVLAGSAAISYFSDVEDGSTDAALSLDEQRSLIREVADEWGGLVPALREVAEEMDRVAKRDDLTKATSAAIEREFRDAQPAIEDARRAVLQFSAEVNGVGENAESLSRLRSDFAAFREASEDLNRTLREGKDTTAAYERFNVSLAAVLSNQAVSAQDDLEAAIRRVESAFRDAAAAGRTLAEQRATAQLGERELGLLGTVPPVYSFGGQLRNEAEVQDERARNTPSLFQTEQDRLARRNRRRGRSPEERSAERYDSIVRQAEQAIEMQMLEAQALSMTEGAADRLRQQQELLNQARAAGIDLTPQQEAELRALGITMADVTAELREQTEALDQRRAIVTDVIGGIRQAAADGKITLEELGQIGLRVLDRLIDKMEGDLVDAITSVGGASRGGGGSGGGILGFIGSLFGFGSRLSPSASAAIAGGRAFTFDSGGWTGSGHPADPAGVVHREEFVFSAPAVRTIGVGNLERMHQAARTGRGFAEGGYAGGGYPAGKGGGAGGRGDVNIHVHLDGANGDEHVKRLVSAGVEEGLRRYDSALPDRVQAISLDPRGR